MDTCHGSEFLGSCALQLVEPGKVSSRAPKFKPSAFQVLSSALAIVQAPGLSSEAEQDEGPGHQRVTHQHEPQGRQPAYPHPLSQLDQSLNLICLHLEMPKDQEESG